MLIRLEAYPDLPEIASSTKAEGRTEGGRAARVMEENMHQAVT